MTKFKIVFSLLSCLFLTASCSRTEVFQKRIDPSFVEVQLGQAAEIAHDNLALFAKLRNVGVKPLLPAPSPELERRITVRWTGSASGALEKICSIIRYELREIGNIPAQPITLVIRGSNRKTYDVLEDIAWQILPSAILRIDTVNQIITIAYGG